MTEEMTHGTSSVFGPQRLHYHSTLNLPPRFILGHILGVLLNAPANVTLFRKRTCPGCQPFGKGDVIWRQISQVLLSPSCMYQNAPHCIQTNTCRGIWNIVHTVEGT